MEIAQEEFEAHLLGSIVSRVEQKPLVPTTSWAPKHRSRFNHAVSTALVKANSGKVVERVRKSSLGTYVAGETTDMPEADDHELEIR